MTSNVSPLGLKLFFLYLAAYGVFVALNAYWPGVMKTPAFAGVNLALEDTVDAALYGVLRTPPAIHVEPCPMRQAVGRVF